MKVDIFMKTRAQFARLAAFATMAASTGAAMAADPATALEGLQTLSGSATGFGPVLFGLAVVSVGILIGVKWIKRGKGAS